MGIGQSVSIQCNIGFRPDPGANGGTSQPSCVANRSSTVIGAGFYTPGVRCTPISCGAYLPPVDGSVSPRGEVLFNQTLVITCDPGFKPSGPGSETPLCHADGSFGLGVGCARVPLVCLSAVTEAGADTAAANTAPFANRTCDRYPPPPLPGEEHSRLSSCSERCGARRQGGRREREGLCPRAGRRSAEWEEGGAGENQQPRPAPPTALHVCTAAAPRTRAGDAAIRPPAPAPGAGPHR